VIDPCCGLNEAAEAAASAARERSQALSVRISDRVQLETGTFICPRRPEYLMGRKDQQRSDAI
jgi:hypothetical protein